MSIWIAVFVMCFNPIKKTTPDKIECEANIGGAFDSHDKCIKESAKKFYVRPYCVEKKL